MKKSMLRILSFMAIGALMSAFAFAQDSRVASAAGDLYVISAKAGGVNYIEGKVAVARKNARSGYLVKGDNVEIGDKVSTGANGRAEILLNPGSYLRLGDNSTFEFVSTELENLQLKLKSGTAIFEVFANNDFRVTVDTPKANFYLVQSGIYRIDILPDGTEKIEVRKGRAEIGNAEVVKSGRSAIINGGQATITKFNRKDQDALEVWSKSRAKDLARMNSQLERNAMRNSLLNSYNQRSWNLYNSFGVWVLNRFNGTYCFLPFGYGWQSPYGYGFGYDFWNYRLPRYIYTNPNPSPGGSNNPPPSSIPSNAERRERLITPPFQRMQGSEGRAPIDNGSFDSPMPSRGQRPIMVAPAPSSADSPVKVRGN